MPFAITITEEADRQFRSMPTHDQRVLEAAILSRLRNKPMITTRAIKRLRPNPLAEFELRVGNLRVLYNVELNEVVILIAGRKDGNKLIVEGQEFHGHQDNSAESTGDDTRTNAE